MTRKVSIILFWTLIVLSVVALSRMTWQDWRGSLRTGAFVVPFVIVTSWFQSRFTGPKRRAATIMVYSVLGAMVGGSVTFWDWMLYRSGYLEQRNLVEAAVGGAIFIVCFSVSVWSLFRLCRRTEKLPT